MNVNSYIKIMKFIVLMNLANFLLFIRLVNVIFMIGNVMK